MACVIDSRLGASAPAAAPTNYESTFKMDFVPMLWCVNISAGELTQVKVFIMSHPGIQYLLVMNEPNLINQANRTPLQVAADRIRYEQVIRELADLGRTVYLVGPAITWGTMTGYADPVVWLDAFYTAHREANSGRDPQIDYLAFYWHDYGLNAQLERLGKYNKKIWITEMANWNDRINTDAKQKQQMTEMVTICENRDDVFRYAWFYGRGDFPDRHFTYLFTPNDGELSKPAGSISNCPSRSERPQQPHGTPNIGRRVYKRRNSFPSSSVYLKFLTSQPDISSRARGEKVSSMRLYSSTPPVLAV